MATEDQLGWKMVHHTPRYTNLASHAVVCKKGAAIGLLIIHEIFLYIDVFWWTLSWGEGC